MIRTIQLTQEEAEAVHGLIDQLSGGNPQNVFAWDGSDDINDPTISAMVKIFLFAGHQVPNGLFA